MNTLIRRFRKEGHKIFLLTGRRFDSGSYEKVYQKYEFDYDDGGINDIFDSADADVVIYTGAFDTNCLWDDKHTDSVPFISGLISLLSAFNHHHKGRFVYLSSAQVFQGKWDAGIKEDTKPEPGSSAYAMAVAQGEELCRSFNSGYGLDYMILRLGEVYGQPVDLKDCRDQITGMIIKAMQDGVLVETDRKFLSPLADGDAVQFIYQASTSEKHQYNIYHISSDTWLSKYDLGVLIKNKLAEFADQKDKDAASGKDPDANKNRPYRARRIIEVNQSMQKEIPEQKAVLNTDRFNQEFHINRLTQLETGLQNTITWMLKHEAVFMQDLEVQPDFLQKLKKNTNWLIKASIPFIENCILFIPFFMLNNRAVGSTYFSRLDFYLLYVILFAIVHGQTQAVFSAVLATAGFIFRQMYTRTGFQVMIDYNTYVWVAQLFIIGLSIGHLRDQLDRKTDEAKEDHQYLTRQLGDMRSINHSNVRIKDSLQTQIINEENSLGKIYEITSALNQYSADEVIFYAADAVRKITGSPDIAIYRVHQSRFARLFTATSKAASKLGNSFKYEEVGELSKALVNKRVFVNRKLDENVPMMAVGIYNEDSLAYIVMVWSLSWEKMTLGEENVLAVTSALVKEAVNRSDRYLEAVKEERYMPGLPVLKPEAFMKLVKAYAKAQNDNLTVYSILRVQAVSAPGVTIRDLTKCVRDTDYLGKANDTHLYILLTNTDNQSAQIVIDRLAQKGIVCSLKKGELS